MSITFEINKPNAPPKRVEAVIWETALPDISPILLFFDNCKLMLALDAEANKKQMFLLTLATEANSRKC